MCWKVFEKVNWKEWGLELTKENRNEPVALELLISGD
jgi:hypothetical protein